MFLVFEVLYKKDAFLVHFCTFIESSSKHYEEYLTLIFGKIMLIPGVCLKGVMKVGFASVFSILTKILKARQNVNFKL